MKSSQFIAAVTVLALAATGAVAAGGKHGTKGPKASFQELDANGDGQVTQGELQDHRAARFAKLDSDGDGKLSAAELQAEGQKKGTERANRMIEKFDTDGDGALSAQEMPQPRDSGKLFARMDSDGSGGISQQEFDSARAKLKDKKQGATDQN